MAHGKTYTMMITFIFIGLMVSGTILIANDRQVLIDEIATQLNVEAWEIAYFTYICFLMLAVIYDMVTDRNGRMNAEDWLGMVVIILVSIVSFVGLQALSVGSIATAVNLMITENNNWWLFYSLIIGVYIANKMLVKFK